MTKPTITTHPNPLWRSKADYVAFAIVAEDYDGAPWYEQLAGRSMGDDTMEICCIPLAAREISLGDVVRLTAREDGLVVSEIITRSDWFSYRAMLRVETPKDAARVLRTLEIPGVEHELGHRPIVGFAAKGEQAAQQLVDALDRLEAAGDLEWESAAR